MYLKSLNLPLTLLILITSQNAFSSNTCIDYFPHTIRTIRLDGLPDGALKERVLRQVIKNIRNQSLRKKMAYPAELAILFGPFDVEYTYNIDMGTIEAFHITSRNSMYEDRYTFDEFLQSRWYAFNNIDASQEHFLMIWQRTPRRRVFAETPLERSFRTYYFELLGNEIPYAYWPFRQQ